MSSKMDITITPFLFFKVFFITSNNTTENFSHPFSVNIISRLPLFFCQLYSSLLNPHLHPHSFPFSLSWCHLSSCVSLCQSLSCFHPPLISSSHPPTQERIQVSQFHLGHASCLQRSILLLWNGLLSSSRAFSFGQLGFFALTLKLLLGVCERGDGLV